MCLCREEQQWPIVPIICIKEPHSAHLHSRLWPDFSGNELWTEHSLKATRHFPLLGSNSSSGTLTHT